jgi:hypothetical protein
MTKEESDKLVEKIIIGLEKAYKKLIEFKKQKGSEIVMWQDGKIVRIKP